MDQSHSIVYSTSHISSTPVYEADCGQATGSHAESSDFTTNGRDGLVSATHSVALSQVDDGRCMRQRNANETLSYSLSQQHIHHPDLASIPSSPNTLTSYSSARSPASHCGPPSCSLNSSSVSYQLSPSGYNTPSLQNNHTSYPSLNGISNCRTRAPSISEQSMFFSAVPPRTYSNGPNTLAASTPVLPGSPRESYSSTPQSISRSIDYRSSLDISKTFPQTRPLYGSHASMSYSHLNPVYSNSTSYAADYRGDSPEQTLPFADPETFYDLVTHDMAQFRPEINCNIEKGFFYSNERSWTCYRRNYFSVSCSYSFEPHVNGANIYIKKKNERTNAPALKQIQALSLSLSASIDGANGKTIELVQHTPKRDKGPQLKVSYTKLCPSAKNALHPSSSTMGHYPSSNYSYHTQTSSSSNCPILPFQNAENQSKDTKEAMTAGISFPPPTSSAHTFERIQFKNATANNGKRRAQQQYYHLIVELYADVRLSSDAPEDWVKVAHRISNQVVVRGRSPSHYQNEGPTSNGRTTTIATMGRQSGWSPYQSAPGSNVYVASSAGGRMISTPSNYLYSAVSSIPEPNGSMGHSMLGSSGMSNMEPSRGLASSLTSGRSLYTGHAGPGAADDDNGSYSYYPQSFYDAGIASSSSALVKNESKTSSSPESATGTFSHALQTRYAAYDTSKGLYPSQTHAL